MLESFGQIMVMSHRHIGGIVGKTPKRRERVGPFLSNAKTMGLPDCQIDAASDQFGYGNIFLAGKLFKLGVLRFIQLNLCADHIALTGNIPGVKLSH